MAPLLIPVVTLVIALAGLVLAIFALVLIAAQRLDNAQLPARRRSDRDPDDANARALFGRSGFRPRPFRMSDTEPIPKSDPITQAHRDRIRHTEAVAESYGTPAIPNTDVYPDPIADALANEHPDVRAHGYCDPKPFADTDVFADCISISDPKTVYLTDFKSDRDS